MKTYSDFEVIDIMGDNYPYPALLGIDLEFENCVVIDIKLETITFEVDGVRFIQPLDPWVNILIFERGVVLGSLGSTLITFAPD